MNQDESQKKTVGIIGAGFAGLALANILTKHDVSYSLFDRSASSITVSGSLQIPSANHAMKVLGLSCRYADEGNSVNRTEFLTVLRERIQIQYKTSITGILEKGSKIFCIDSKSDCYGPFDVIVGADGVFSVIRKCSFNKPGITGLIGDARWAQDVFWDFGSTRIRCGADLAIRDGIECGLLLIKDQIDLGKFDAEHKHSKRLWSRRTFWILLLALAVLSQTWLQ